jgi:hypothetical protein
MQPKKVVLFFALSISTIMNAQIRMGVAFGPLASLKGKNSDNAFFAKKYTSTQLRFCWHKGRLAIVFTGGAIQQTADKTAPDKLLNGLPAGLDFNVTTSSVKNTFFLLGPEICFPVGPMKMHLHISGGKGFFKAPGTKIIANDAACTLYYQDILDEETSTAVFKTGANLNYHLTRHLAIGLYVDYFTYRLRYKNFNRINGNFEMEYISQQKSLVGVSGGITYKF